MEVGESDATRPSPIDEEERPGAEMGLREIQEDSSPRVRCALCGAEQDTSIEDGSCPRCGAEPAAATAVEEADIDSEVVVTTAAESPGDGSRYWEIRERLGAILRDLRPGDVDHAAEMAEELTSWRKLRPAIALVLLVLLLPAGWLVAGLTNRFTVQSRVTQDANRLAQRIESHRGETGLYPDAATWQAWVNGSDADAFLDPWRRPYLYSVDSRAFSIATYGSDGRPGGSLENKDLTLVFPYVNSRMALPHAQPKSSPVSP
jgi:hypothetical protein